MHPVPSVEGLLDRVRKLVRRSALLAPAGGAMLFISACGGRAGAAVESNSASRDSMYSAGACQQLAPLSGNAGRTVFIDPGHGGPDPGVSGTTQDGDDIEEKTATLAVGIDVAELLRERGYSVVLARDADTSVARLGPGDTVQGSYTDAADHRDLVARVTCANSTHADLLLSIHFNSYQDPSVGGSETLYDAVRPFASKSERFAQLVQNDVVSALHAAGWDVPDRGIAPDTSDDEPALTSRAAAYPYLLELGPAQKGWLESPSAMPGALCESLFLTDPFEASIAASQQGQQVIAQGMARAVQAYFASLATATPGHARAGAG